MASATANPPAPVQQTSRGSGILPKAQELLDAGWECIGEPNDTGAAQWLDPTMPAEETITEEPKFGWVMTTTEERDARGYPIVKAEWKQLFGQDGTPENRNPKPIKQTCVTCPAQPVTLIEAAMILRERKIKAKKAKEATDKHR